MHTLRVNGYDMAYLELGRGAPLVCVHGTLGDFRTWSAVMGPLSKKHRVISVSLRHFFPEDWDGAGNGYKIAQHVADMIAFIEQIEPKPVDLMGHSRGGHIAFRVAQQRPDLLRKLILAEPGGDLDATLEPPGALKPVSPAARIRASIEMIRSGNIDRALSNFVDVIEGDGAWARLPATAKQQLRDNAATLLGQVGEAGGRPAMGHDRPNLVLVVLGDLGPGGNAGHQGNGGSADKQGRRNSIHVSHRLHVLLFLSSAQGLRIPIR